MTTTTDPNRFADADYRKKALASAVFLGEPAATELKAALHTIEKQAKELEALRQGEPRS